MKKVEHRVEREGEQDPAGDDQESECRRSSAHGAPVPSRAPTRSPDDGQDGRSDERHEPEPEQDRPHVGEVRSLPQVEDRLATDRLVE